MAVTQTQFERAFQDNLSKAGFTLAIRDVQELLQIMSKTIESCLKENIKTVKANGNGNPEVVVRGVGRFTIRSYAARMGRNPQTGKAIKIKASKRLRVTAPKALRENLRVK